MIIPNIHKLAFILLFITNSAFSSEPPYKLKKFQPTLDNAKLQWPDSSSIVSYGQFDGFADSYFYLSKGKYMTFSLSKSKGTGTKRVELRQGPNEWKTSTKTPKKIIAEVKCFKPNLIEEYTWMQIHDSTKFNKPLVRLLWKKSRVGKNNHLWAVLRTSLDKKYKWYDLGERTDSFFKAEIKVKNNNLVVKINNKEQVNHNISYWEGMSSYFKAGLYLNAKNDTGDAKVQFKELKYY